MVMKKLFFTNFNMCYRIKKKKLKKQKNEGSKKTNKMKVIFQEFQVGCIDL